MIAMSSIPVASKSFIARRVSDEAILISEEGDVLHTLNETGSFIWAQVDGTRSLSEIRTLLCEEFEVAEDRAEQDIMAFVEELHRKGILRIRTG
jgi:hypothetical protein